jgi:RNA polymerase sigma factor (TIGR02999 family)
MTQTPSDSTTIGNGEPQTTDALFGAVYDRLKAMAGSHLARDRGGSTLDTTALVHELYLRVSTNRELLFGKPVQFFAYAARAMRHLLADRARDRLRLRAGGQWMRVTLTGTDDRLAIDSAEQALALDEALKKLEGADARAARVVELRYFAGLTPEQIADVLGVTRRTVDRDWRFARAFLKTEIE